MLQVEKMSRNQSFPEFDDEQWLKLKTAKKLIGCKDMTTFIRIAALEKANKIIRENTTTSGKIKKWFTEDFDE